jgi:hypothetical protein
VVYAAVGPDTNYCSYTVLNPGGLAVGPCISPGIWWCTQLWALALHTVAILNPGGVAVGPGTSPGILVVYADVGPGFTYCSYT